jgi:hypothetical protein
MLARPRIQRILFSGFRKRQVRGPRFSPRGTP